MNNLVKKCPTCKKEELRTVFFFRSFFPGGKEVKVRLLKSVCSSCGLEITSGTQHDHNLSKLSERRKDYGVYPLGEDYSKLKKKYNLTNHDLAKIFGRKLATVGAYCSERSYPDTAICHLVRIMLSKPSIFKEISSFLPSSIQTLKEAK